MTSSVGGLDESILASINTRKKKDDSQVEQTQQQFLKMLTAQVQNQDPLNPMDNSDMTSQMAQLSAVEGITQLNSTLDTLMNSLSSNQTLEAASMIGRGVLVSGNTVTLAKGEDSAIGIMGVDLQGAASSVQVKIYNSNGGVVQTIDLGAQSPGVIPVAWDGSTATGGMADAGNYTFMIEAKTSNGDAVVASTLKFGEVSAVTKSSDNSVVLNTTTAGDITLSQIRQVL